MPLWSDEDLELGTANYEQKIRGAIGDSFCLVLLASPHSVASNYVLGELRIAQSKGIPIYPAWISGDAWEESVLTELIAAQYVDLRCERYSQGIRSLEQKLKNLIDTVFPPYLDASETPSPPAELYLTIAQSLHLRADAYRTTGHLLDAVSRLVMSSHHEPIYGKGWILGRRRRYSERYSRPDRLFAPLKWLAARSSPVPIAVYDPAWLERSPGCSATITFAGSRQLDLPVSVVLAA